MHWQTTRFRIDLSQPRVMGIVNLTPDSFSDGGRLDSTGAALRHCEQLLREGAHVLDIGGESTRPGARPPPPGEEARRVLPVLREALAFGVPLSVDTSDTALMRVSLELGVDIINDVRSLRRPGALELLAAHGSAGICLMHLRGEPETMAAHAVYGDVVSEVHAELGERYEEVRVAGVAADRIVLDPGIGFAKTAEHNLALLRRQRELLSLPAPLLLGWSRKGTIGQVTGRAVHDRLHGSVAAALLAVERGARIVRVHDVAATVDALKLWHAASAV